LTSKQRDLFGLEFATFAMESRKLLSETKAKILADLEIQRAQMDSKIAEANLAAQEATLKLKEIAVVEEKSKRELQTSCSC